MKRSATRACTLCLGALLFALPMSGRAQEGQVYVPETDPLVLEKLEGWQDLKLGLLMHWGPYSQWGIVESWSLCSEDVGWCRRSMEDYGEYKKAYEALQTTFDPTGFDPERWARAAAEAGMKYVVFTTKHHDGFSMFDTRLTDYRITAPATPFSTDPRADVTRGIFDAFRAEGFMTGAYFSKPDWHSPDYWWPNFATPDRNPNYDIQRYPERWQRFVEFTHGQIDELMTGYGPVDILWLDGGWVQPLTPDEVRGYMSRPDNSQLRVQSQDIDMPRLVANARQKQPGLIVVDRAVPGPYQNYLTPEARVPEQALPYPWEVPMPMAGSWSFVPEDRYKPARVLVHMLADVVSKGGNLLLNIGPGPDGRWHDAAYDRLRELGAWMDVNGEAIYETRALAPYGEGKVRLTRRADGAVYLIYLAEEGEARLPARVSMTELRPAPGATVSLLGVEGTLPWRAQGRGFTVELPEAMRDDPPGDYAWVFRISAVQDAPAAGAADPGEATAPPPPLLPIPSARQLAWQRDEMRMFLHFTVNTFTDREWGTGGEDPAIFDPALLDARQWARVARETGFGALILTAKHHDGFNLWPSRLSDHSVEKSPWRGGRGDVVAEVAEAARAEGLSLGLYLSPWDRHEPSYGDEAAYNRFYLGQLRELLSRYGPVSEVWFDGAKGEDAKDMEYHFEAYRALVRQLQPGAVMFSDEGPDVRWIGNERGFAGESNWSTLDTAKVAIGGPGQGAYLNRGEMGGPAWVPGECDVSIRRGWFWHADQEPKSLDDLLEIYFKSVGRNCLLLLNVPPDPEGRLSPADVSRLREFRAALDGIFERDLARGATAVADKRWGDSPDFGGGRVVDGDPDSYWAASSGSHTGAVTLELEEEATFDVVLLREPIALGQRVTRYRVEAQVDGAWQTVCEGTTIGHKKLDVLGAPVTTSRVRIVVGDALAEPLIAQLGLYLAPPGVPLPRPTPGAGG